MKSQCLFVLVFASATLALSAAEPQPPEPTAEHGLLKRFVGEWECTSEAFFDPENPATSKGTMTGRMIGNFWAVVEVTADIGSEEQFRGLGTYGFDSLKTKRCTGTWTDSMSPFLWKYDGKVDGKKLILDTEGPDPSDPKKMLKMRDTWEFKSEDLIVLTGEMEGPDGKLAVFMKSTCRRKKASPQ